MSSVFIDSEKFSAAAPWDVVVQLCRRICLLRHTGREAEAGRLHDHEFAHAIAALPPSADLELRVQTLFVTEEKRVSEAQVLAEIMGPLLIEQLRHAFTFAPATAPLAAAAAATAPAAPEVAPAHTAAASEAPPPSRPVRTTAPSIADFIDDMLSQERPARRAS